MTFGKWLTKTREKQGLTLEEVATAAGLSKSSIYMIENGGTDPRLDSATRISKALGLPLWKALKQAGESNGKAKKTG